MLRSRSTSSTNGVPVTQSCESCLASSRFQDFAVMGQMLRPQWSWIMHARYVAESTWSAQETTLLKLGFTCMQPHLARQRHAGRATLRPHREGCAACKPIALSCIRLPSQRCRQELPEKRELNCRLSRMPCCARPAGASCGSNGRSRLWYPLAQASVNVVCKHCCCRFVCRDWALFETPG